MELFLAYLVFLTLASPPRRASAERVLLVLACLIPLFAVGLFRTEIGTDWPSYEAIYEATSEGFYLYEPGWILLNVVATWLGDFQYVIALGYSLILIVLCAIALRERTIILLLACFCLFRLGIYFTRIELSCFVLLPALFSDRPGRRKSILFLILAPLFHWSCIIPVAILVAWYQYFSGRRWPIFLVLALTAGLLALSEQASDSVLNHLFEVESTYDSDFLRLILKSLSLAVFLACATRSAKAAPHILFTGWTILLATTIGSYFSPGIERLFVFVYPVVLYVLTRSWREMQLERRLLCILTLIAIYMSWLNSPFNDLYFPIKTILPI